jgi:hypothetical protein
MERVAAAGVWLTAAVLAWLGMLLSMVRYAAYGSVGDPNHISDHGSDRRVCSAGRTGS